MTIQKIKGTFNSFKIDGITEGKLMAISRALQQQQDRGEITSVGQDVLNTIIIALDEAKVDNEMF